MKFLHYDLNLVAGESIRVNLDRQANVRLLDDANFLKYKQGARHKYYGGKALKSPLLLSAPYTGHWHLVIDLGGYKGSVGASVDRVGG